MMNPTTTALRSGLVVRSAIGRYYSVPGVKPVLTIPVKLQQKLQLALAKKQEEDRLVKSRQGNLNVSIVVCKNSALNHYLGTSYGTFDEVPLASKGWSHKKAVGDFFTIQSHGKNPSLILDSKTFRDLGLDEGIAQALFSLGLDNPTVIQRNSVRPVLQGDNCLIAAETGSGKTLAYLCPVLQLLKNTKPLGAPCEPNTPRALVLTPGRELAEQIGWVCERLGDQIGLETVVEVGGRLKRRTLYGAAKKVDVLVATLGAASKLTTNKVYNMQEVQHIVLDEADTLLDDSFNEKLMYFLRKFPLQAVKIPTGVGPVCVQVIMASATIPTSAEKILGDILPYSSFTRVTTDYLHRLLPHVPQKFLRLSPRDKAVKLLELVRKDVSHGRSVIIFSSNSKTCDWVTLFLEDNGIESVNLNGNLSQRLRQDRFQKYASNKVKVLSCTDVVSRGLDTQGTHHVINFDMALNMSDYIHRCGRVGRVGSCDQLGHVTNFVCSPAEIELTQKIEFAARKSNDSLPNVNANIKRLIASRLV